MDFTSRATDRRALLEYINERILKLTKRLESEALAVQNSESRICVDSIVRLRDLETGERVAYRVSGGRGDPARGEVSEEAPLARALVGRYARDRIRGPGSGRRLQLRSAECGNTRRHRPGGEETSPKRDCRVTEGSPEASYSSEAIRGPIVILHPQFPCGPSVAFRS